MIPAPGPITSLDLQLPLKVSTSIVKSSKFRFGVCWKALKYMGIISNILIAVMTNATTKRQLLFAVDARSFVTVPEIVKRKAGSNDTKICVIRISNRKRPTTKELGPKQRSQDLQEMPFFLYGIR